MGKRYPELQPDQIAFIAEQKVFCVATAPVTGRVNVSPKGMDSLRVLSPSRILWLNVTGSGNETAAHLAEDPRITLMWMGFETRPIILRAYGTAQVTHHNEPGWDALAAQLPDVPGARQIVDVAIELVQSSCGFAVPYMEFKGERPTLRTWAEGKGDQGLREYWAGCNGETIDGQPTGIEKAL
ncbi:pyridoxamine 5'-phosphate oxidase family protein [Neogemmobacter tilapiae]|uniref:Pyridoxamine 5'-phosphate oxidase n=1 Tax=Neogemmobacter tilapiae TaxID=875041 RepID=A0A918TSL4_9RHOB|nr:pyridoxamine 5'-phosphate oxidase family protein [Gemmobacter tilapiae]GHC58107.1 pyridoxamine 5'-phosphate oxidase [Gemmobacter tilapiae]